MKSLYALIAELTKDDWEALDLWSFEVRHSFEPNDTTPKKYREYQAAVKFAMIVLTAYEQLTTTSE